MRTHQYDLTAGNLKRTAIRFALPYLLACFLQTFYGLTDLFVVGLYNGPETSTAVAIGSQVMHMLTVMIVGLTMGTTVSLGRCIGGKAYEQAQKIVGSSTALFFILAIVLTPVLIFFTSDIARLMLTPSEALDDANAYLVVCFSGLPFIIAYNVICGIYRGIGDSRSPLFFAAIACVVNIVVDFIFIGFFKLGAIGAAYATILGQGTSVALALYFLKRACLGVSLQTHDLLPTRSAILSILKVGFPICMQDGFIQVAFIIITIIANARGLIDSVSVGVVEKIICFLFLVPSAFLSTISAVTAQNMGAGKSERARECLRFGLNVTVVWGIFCFLYCQFFPSTLIGLFRTEPEIISSANSYLRSYSIDCILAAIHFCFSGFFCGVQRSGISFLHNILSVTLIRIPGTYFASMAFSTTLYPMGLAAPLGSLLSVVICLFAYVYYRRRGII